MQLKTFQRKSYLFTMTAGQENIFDINMGFDIDLLSGCYRIDGNVANGDYAELEVVDKDGVAYPAGTILSEFVKSEYLMPNGNETIKSQSGSIIPAPMYIRIRYVSVGTINVQMIVRLEYFK